MKIVHVPIAGRPPLARPNGSRVAVFGVVNVEAWVRCANPAPGSDG